MAEESLFNQGVPFAAGVSGGINPYAGVQRELARADQKKAEGEERAFKLANAIKQADRTQLFGQHYDIANRWASSLFEQVGDYSKSASKSMEFLAQANALVGYIERQKNYKAANMGDPSDELITPSYYGQVNRKVSGGNAFAATDQKEVNKDFEAVLDDLNSPVQGFVLGENGPMIDDGEGLVPLVEYQDPKAPFMFELEEDLSMPLPGEWYEAWAKTRGKITDGSAEAAKRFFEEKVASEDVSLRKLMNWWKGVSGSEKSLDELVAEQGSVKRAIDEYGNLVAQKWTDLNDDGESQAAAQMFSTGEASFDRELKYTEGAPVLNEEIAKELASRGTEGLLQGLGDYNEFRGLVGSTPVEYLGFENLMLLNADEDSDFLITPQEAGDLVDGQLIDAVNVDSMGNIHARLKTAGPVLDDDDMPVYGADMKPLMEVKEEFVVYSPDDPDGRAMFNSIKAHLENAQTGVNHYERMMRESVRNGAAARRKATKDLVLKAEQEAAARKAEATTAGTTDPATTPEEADANADATPPPSREEAPPVVEADREALSAISKGLADAGQQPGTETTAPRLIKTPDGVPRSNHFNDASESLLSQNYSHGEIVAAFNDPRFSEALIESGYDGDERKDSRGPGGGLVDAFGNWSGHRFFKGMKSDYTKEVEKVEATLKSIMDDRATAQAASGPIDPEPMDPIVTDEAPTAEAPTERDFSGLPELSSAAISAAEGISLSEGYSTDEAVNWPGGNSGVTIAGIDIGAVSGDEDIKLKILKPFVSKEDYEAMTRLKGLTGEEARDALKKEQNNGFLDPEEMFKNDADLKNIAAYGVQAFVLPRIYRTLEDNNISREEFDSLPSAVTDAIVNIEFMTPGKNTRNAIAKAIKKNKKKFWIDVADMYYKPAVQGESLDQEKDAFAKYYGNENMLAVDDDGKRLFEPPYEMTYYGSASESDTKLDNYKQKRKGTKQILPGNINRLLEARWQILNWANTYYGNE